METSDRGILFKKQCERAKVEKEWEDGLSGSGHMEGLAVGNMAQSSMINLKGMMRTSLLKTKVLETERDSSCHQG